MKRGIINRLVFKNSVYNLISVFIGKLGGLIFTILIARLLLPDLFGVYNLVLSIILIAITFTDMGINGTALRYFSKTIGDKKFSKFRGYFSYLFKLKISISLTIIAILLLITKYLAYTVFNKPEIVLPLVVAGLYIIAISIKDLYLTLIYALKEVRSTPIIEATNQISKIVLSFLAISYLSEGWRLAGLFIGFAISIFMSLLITLFFLRKRKAMFMGTKKPVMKKKLISYISLLGITGFSLAFFASVDTLMLGRFLESEYIGIYRAGLSLILTVSSLLAFSNVILPVFTQLKKTNFSKASKDISRYILLLAIPATGGMMVLSKGIITMIFGADYTSSYIIVFTMAPLIIIFPLVSFYSSLYQARGKVKSLAICTFVALIANILLNYYLIKNLLTFSQIHSIVGAGIATTLSWAILLILLIVNSNNESRILINKISLLKITFASLVMAAVVSKLNNLLTENSILTSIFLIFLGICIYGGTLLIIKEINKSDLELLKSGSKNS